jgi:hypothetical protein
MYVFLLTFVDESSTRNANIVAVVIQANRDKKKGACQRCRNEKIVGFDQMPLARISDAAWAESNNK